MTSAWAILAPKCCQEKSTRKRNLFIKCCFILVWLPHSKRSSSSVGRLNKAASQNKAERVKRERKHSGALFWKSQTKWTQRAEKKSIYHSFTAFCFFTAHTVSVDYMSSLWQTVSPQKFVKRRHVCKRVCRLREKSEKESILPIRRRKQERCTRTQQCDTEVAKKVRTLSGLRVRGFTFSSD